MMILKISGSSKHGRDRRRCGHSKQWATEKGKEDEVNMNKNVSMGEEDQVNMNAMLVLLRR